MSILKMRFVFFLFAVLPSLGAAQSSAPGPEELFTQGTQHYLAKDYAKAKDTLTQSLEKDPHNPIVLTNLALAEFQLGNKALAVGLLRKALTFDPDLQVANAGLKFALSQMQIREVPRQIETYETIRSHLLQPIPLYAYLVLSALLFFSSGWLLLIYFGRRRRALQEEAALPTFPTVGAILSLSLVIFTGLLALKAYDSYMTRGTIIEEKVALQTAPGENQVSVIDLYGGMEVIVRSTQGDWAQVTYPGSLTGWIKKNSLLLTR